MDLTRRDFLRRSAAAAGYLALPSIIAACGREPEPVTQPTTIDTGNIRGSRIKVSTYGGFFEENFRKMYPAFTEETGVEVESVAEPTSEVWVTQLQQSVQAGTEPPSDVSMLSGVGIQRAINGEIFAPIDLSAVPNAKFLAEGFVREAEDGRVAGIGAVSWFITIVSNTERVAESPDTWTAFWDAEWENELALLKNAGNSFLLEITAASFFDGLEILQTQDGILEVMTKLQEVKPNVKLWFRDEAQAQQAYNTGEVSLGQFYHDITTYAASQGEPLRSVFPTEGAILDSGFWHISGNSENVAACHAFIDYMCQPEIQSELATTLGTSPVLTRENLDLTDEDYEAVSGPGPEAALRPEYEIYDKWEDWIDQNWSEMIVS
ncbi:MAG TPA: substrate-binding domain-containing protein [Actinomycetota bacterium]|nr:substrate-binding domain-containing protein [Actinomycetota bacterium]